MNNIKKIFLALTGAVFLSSTAYAGELTVTGAAKASYRINSSDSSTGASNAGKGIGIGNEITFGATGELDNGIAWKYSMDFDNADRSATSGGIDDSRLEFTTTVGTIGIYGSEGSLRAAALGWDVSAFGAGSDNGDGGGMVLGSEISSYNNLQYHTPADLLPFGIVVKAAHSPNADTGPVDFKGAGSQGDVKFAAWDGTAERTGANYESVSQFLVEAAPIDGLAVKLDYTDFSHNAAANNAEEGHASLKYAYGPVTVGYGRGWIAPVNDKAAGSVDHFENKSMGLGFKVNDALSLSYTVEKSQLELNTSSAAEVELELTSIQAAYNIGGATIAISQDDISNANYTLAKDTKETLITMVMAF